MYLLIGLCQRNMPTPTLLKYVAQEGEENERLILQRAGVKNDTRGFFYIFYRKLLHRARALTVQYTLSPFVALLHRLRV